MRKSIVLVAGLLATVFVIVAMGIAIVNPPNAPSLPAPQTVHADSPPPPPLTPTPAPRPTPTPPQQQPPPSSSVSRHLVIPVKGATAKDIQDTFDEGRGSEHKHEATDILAPLGTPVIAVDDGVIEKLFLSKPGGITIYQFDPTRQYSYYYAHLERYADGLQEGKRVRQGDIIGYVGTTGNAPPGTPHLHFAIFLLGPDKRWWEGAPVNPYPKLIRGRTP